MGTPDQTAELPEMQVRLSYRVPYSKSCWGVGGGGAELLKGSSISLPPIWLARGLEEAGRGWNGVLRSSEMSFMEVFLKMPLFQAGCKPGSIVHASLTRLCPEKKAQMRG